MNVFHHLFYEGNVDIFSIEDPLVRNATIGFINNFGQVRQNVDRYRVLKSDKSCVTYMHSGRGEG